MKAYKTVVINSGSLDGWPVKHCLEKRGDVPIGVIFVEEGDVGRFESQFAGLLNSKRMWSAEDNVKNLNEVLSPEVPNLPEALDSLFNLDERRKLNKYLTKEARAQIKENALSILADCMGKNVIVANDDTQDADGNPIPEGTEIEEVDLEDLTVAQLKEQCEKQGIEFNASAKKQDLINLLKKDNNESN